MIKYFNHFLFLSILFVVTSVNLIAQEKPMFANPILAGFYPDPSICKVGDNFYLVTSTFAYYPGLPVFQSKDLVNWKLIGHVLDRPEQLNLDGQGVSRGLYAPSIRYNNGTFYVTCTIVDRGGNFIVTSKSPEGPWSNPVWLPEIDGIDPSPFFDNDGKLYIIYNSVAPDNKPLYEGHRTIRIHELDSKTFKAIGDEHIIVNGGTDLSKKPVWIEAPHIFKVNDLYYLIAAEGGTSDQHSEVVFRSKDVLGPYIPYDKNPILTQRDLDLTRKNPITATGHADFVELDNGEWWAVFLGIRPYLIADREYDNTGRETFLAPVKWIDSWPVINPDYKEVQYYYPYPLPPKKEFAVRPYGGNFKLKYNFDKDKLDKDWIFLRTPREKWYDLTSKKGFVTMQLRPETCSGDMNPSFIGHRQQHLTCSASTSIDFMPKSGNEKAGLLIFLSETHFYFLCKSIEDGKPIIQLFKSTDSSSVNNQMELIASKEINKEESSNELNLQIKADRDVYSFYYSFSKENDEAVNWKLLKDKVDAKYVSVNIPKDFTGCIFALYATSMGKESNNKASFDYFEYAGDDAIYENK